MSGFLEKMKKLLGEEFQSGTTTIRELVDDLKVAGDIKEDVRLVEERADDLETRLALIEEALGLGSTITSVPVKRTPAKKRKPS